jgi:uncharacterized protein (TIGR03663 family)
MSQTATTAPRTARLSRPRGELLAYAVLIAAALVVRLIALGDRPFHHDESQDAYFSWILRTRGDYEYQPILHGPVRFYLTALVYLVFGDTDTTARLAPALMGTAMVPLPYLLRDELGRVGAFAAAAALAFGPSFLYFSRFAREDIYVACITLALLVAVFRFLARPGPRLPAVIGALLALSFGTKETTFITVFVAGTFFLAMLALPRWRRAVLDPVRAVGWEAWGWALASFAGVFTVLFTVFLTNPAGLWDGLYEGLAYWLGQHGVGRGGEAWFFYLVVLFAEEWPALLLGAVGAVVALRRPTLLRLFLIWDFVVSLAVYSWAGEKFSWLVLHPLLPLLLLAGLGVQTIWSARGGWAGRVGIAAVVAGVAYLAIASWSANVEHGAEPREFLVSTQSSTAVRGVRDEVEAVLARAQREGRETRVVVDSADGATFPWAWYFRDLPTDFVDLSAAGTVPFDADAVILTEAGRERVRGELGGFTERRFPFRVWWVRDYGAMSPGAWWRWFTRREPWNPTGGLPEWLYVRRAA